MQEKLTTKTESKIRYMTIYDAERNFDTELEQLKVVQEYVRLEKERSSNKEEIKETCYRRYDEIEAGYVDGLWGGKENLNIGI